MQQSLVRTAIWAVALVCVALILGTGNIEAPPEQKVTEVAGTVDVGNLPLDAEGNLRVTGEIILAAPMIRFVGFTSGTVTAPASSFVLRLNRACEAEFPETRACETREITRAIPVPPAPPSPAFIIASDPAASGVVLQCMNVDSVSTYCPDTAPVACCGF
jgi:hypothetical protein